MLGTGRGSQEQWEKKEGRAVFGEYELKIVDLPGIYSLSPYSSEEVVTRNLPN